MSRGLSRTAELMINTEFHMQFVVDRGPVGARPLNKTAVAFVTSYL